MSQARLGGLAVLASAPSMSTGAPSVAKRLRVDVILGALAFVFGLGSLWFPFGRDQGLYFYVAREWVRRGAIPYRDVLDHKTPGIYVLHALVIRVFGESMWGIRLADMLCVLALGHVAARLATPVGTAVPRGLRGLGHLVGAVLYFGYLNWWDTAQSEIWYSTLALGAMAAARHAKREVVALVGAGALAAAAMVMKPPSVWLVLLAVVAVVLRARAAGQGWPLRAARGVALFGAGAVGVLVAVFGYFGAHHALGAMRDIVIGANGYYVTHERGVDNVGDVIERTLDYLGHYQPFSTVGVFAILVGVVAAVARRDRRRLRRWVLASAVSAAAFLAVAMQQKFYMLHWGVMVGPATVVVTSVAAELVEADILPARLRAAAFAAAVLLGFALAGYHSRQWYDANKLVLRRVTGSVTRDEFARRFQFHDIGFDYRDSQDVGDWLRAHSQPDDLVAVRGFNPEIYAVAERRHAGRFFWTTFITQPARAYRRAEWLAEDRAALDQNRPRFAVVHGDVPEGPDSAAYFPGYVRRYESGRFVVLERP